MFPRKPCCRRPRKSCCLHSERRMCWPWRAGSGPSQSPAGTSTSGGGSLGRVRASQEGTTSTSACLDRHADELFNWQMLKVRQSKTYPILFSEKFSVCLSCALSRAHLSAWWQPSSHFACTQKSQTPKHPGMSGTKLHFWIQNGICRAHFNVFIALWKINDQIQLEVLLKFVWSAPNYIIKESNKCIAQYRERGARQGWLASNPQCNADGCQPKKKTTPHYIL